MGLFNGRYDDKLAPEADIPAGEPPSGAASRVPTVIGKDTVLKGEISCDKDILIEGRVEGKVRSTRRVEIGVGGAVYAEISANVLSVRGELHGDCSASKVEIAQTGKVYGNIAAGAIRVAEGATFRGSSKMTTKQSPSPVTPKNQQAPAKPDGPPTEPTT